MEDTFQVTISYIERFIADPDSAKLWKKRSDYNVSENHEISRQYRVQFATVIKENFTSRCGNDYPTTFYDAMKLINPDSWEHEEIFSFDPKSRAIFSKFKPTNFLDKEVMSLTDDTFIRKTLEHQDIDVDAILCEWRSMKSVLGRGNKKDFPPVDWASIGEKVQGHENLFGLIDYFLFQSVFEC